jgi:hypothetical protein
MLGILARKLSERLDGLIFSSSDKQKPENDLSESFRKDEVNDVAISQERSHHVNIDDNGDAPMISPVSRKVSIF